MHYVKDEAASTSRYPDFRRARLVNTIRLGTLHGLHLWEILRRSVATSRPAMHVPKVVDCIVIGGLSSYEYSAKAIVGRHGKSGLNIAQDVLTAVDLFTLVEVTEEHNK
jgi:hypothetical protein